MRAPLSLAKMCYDAASGTVIYRSKMHLGSSAIFKSCPAPSGWRCSVAISPIAMSSWFAARSVG